jgi:hypothetical protein
MSFRDCILKHIQDGVLGPTKTGFMPEAKARELIGIYESLYAKYSETLGDGAAAHAAAETVVRTQEKIILQDIENDIAFVKGLKKIRSDISATKADIASEKSKSKGWAKWAYGDPLQRAIMTKFDEAFTRAKSLERMALVKMGRTVEDFRSKAGGFKQDTAGFLDVVREMGGKNTGNDIAKASADAMRGSMDWLHGLYTGSGGIMGKLDDWVAPHVHTPELLKRGGLSQKTSLSMDEAFNRWKEYILPRLDRERMIDYDTALPMDEDVLLRAMREDFDNIVTRGLADVAKKAQEGKQMFGGGGGLAKRRMESRFYHFKDVESFIEYNREFGLGDDGLFGAYMGHISKMSRDTALMQVLTPKPDGVMRNLELEMVGANMGATSKRFVKGSYDVLTGKADSHGDLPGWYKFFNNWLHLKRAAYLGGAPISALSDSFFGAYAAKINGLPASSVINRYAKMMNPKSMEDRDIARVNFHVASAASGGSLAGARFSDDLGQGGIFPFLSGATNRLSGLATMTDNMKQAFHMEAAGLMSRLQDLSHKWGDIDPVLKKSLSKSGITEKEWTAIMSAEKFIEPQTGAKYIRPEDVVEKDLEAGVKLSDWITEMSDFAVNEPTLATRAITTGAGLAGQGLEHGSALRLFFGNAFFAKSFGVSVIINHLLPSIREAGQGRWARLGATMLGTTVMGALAMQARQVIFGKDPKDMASVNFWVASMLQGGGLGLFGDFLFADTSRTNNSFAETIAGPIPSTMWNIAKAGDLYSLGTEINTEKIAGDLFKIANKEVPLIRLWYTRMIVERMMLDQVEKAIDPSYNDRMRQVEKRMKKQTGQGFWWAPGEALPERSPDLTTAAGGRP